MAQTERELNLPSVQDCPSSSRFFPLTLKGNVSLSGLPNVGVLDEMALAYLDTVGTRTDDVAYKRMRLVLISAHRTLHNRMHQLGHYHDHTLGLNHPEHDDP